MELEDVVYLMETIFLLPLDHFSHSTPPTIRPWSAFYNHHLDHGIDSFNRRAREDA